MKWGSLVWKAAADGEADEMRWVSVGSKLPNVHDELKASEGDRLLGFDGF